MIILHLSTGFFLNTFPMPGFVETVHWRAQSVMGETWESTDNFIRSSWVLWCSSRDTRTPHAPSYYATNITWHSLLVFFSGCPSTFWGPVRVFQNSVLRFTLFWLLFQVRASNPMAFKTIMMLAAPKLLYCMPKGTSNQILDFQALPETPHFPLW